MGAAVMPINLNYAALVALRARGGELEILLLEATVLTGVHTGLHLWQLPGGGEEIADQGNPFRTLEAELEEETGLSLKKNYPDPQLLVVREKVPEHFQRFYLAWETDLQGELRQGEIVDGNKRLGAPTWCSLSFARENLCDAHILVLPWLDEIQSRFQKK